MEAWNLMGGQIDWSAMPIVFAMLGIDDPDRIIRQLFVIRNHHERSNRA